MQHIGIDLGSKESQVCIHEANGKLVEEKRVATKNQLAAYLQTRPPSRVVVETCAEAFGVADAALSLGHEARVVPATLQGQLLVTVYWFRILRRLHNGMSREPARG